MNSIKTTVASINWRNSDTCFGQIIRDLRVSHVCWWRSRSSVISCRLVCRYQGFGEASIFVFIIRVVQESAYLLTPWSTDLIETLTGFQVVKKFLAFYGTRKFITAFTSARHLSLYWASSIQSIPPHPTSWKSILILSSHLHLGLPSGLLPSGFPTKTLYSPRIYMAAYPTRLRSPRFSLRCLRIVGFWSHILLWLWFCVPLEGIHVMSVGPCAVYHTRNDYGFSPTSVIKSTWQTAILT